MTSGSNVSSSGLSPAQWLRQTGLGNPETLRQMLELIERNWQVSLRSQSGVGRVITPGIDEVLRAAFAAAKEQRQPVLAMLQNLLDSSPLPPEFEMVQTQQLVTSEQGVGEERLTELLSEFEGQLGETIAQHQSLLAEQRDLQRRLWNDQWAGALHKAEASFNSQLSAVAQAYEEGLVELQEQLESEGQSLSRITQQVQALQDSVTSIRVKLHDASWQADEAKELNQRAEKLLGSMEKLVKSGQQLEKVQRQKQHQTDEGARQLLSQVKRWQWLVPAAVSFGTLLGFMLYSFIRRAFPTWLAQPRGQFIVMMVLLLLTLALAYLFWRDED